MLVLVHQNIIAEVIFYFLHFRFVHLKLNIGTHAGLMQCDFKNNRSLKEFLNGSGLPVNNEFVCIQLYFQ